MRDANIVEYVQKMRETQSFILRLEATQFGLVPEQFNLDEVKFSYSEKKLEDFVKTQEESLHQILDNDDEIVASEASQDPLD